MRFRITRVVLLPVSIIALAASMFLIAGEQAANASWIRQACVTWTHNPPNYPTHTATACVDYTAISGLDSIDDIGLSCGPKGTGLWDPNKLNINGYNLSVRVLNGSNVVSVPWAANDGGNVANCGPDGVNSYTPSSNQAGGNTHLRLNWEMEPNFGSGQPDPANHPDLKIDFYGGTICDQSNSINGGQYGNWNACVPIDPFPNCPTVCKVDGHMVSNQSSITRRLGRFDRVTLSVH